MAKPMASSTDQPIEYIWRPQPGPQAELVRCPVFEVFYGGARGGGKTDAMLGGDWPLHAHRYGQFAKGIFFRRELPQLDAAIARSKELYFPLGATWKEQPKTWVFPNGATLRFRPLERDSDAEKYQGHDYTRVYFEELTNYPDPKPVQKLKATLRSGSGVPCGFRATGNPGGPGHNWVKDRYIDPAPNGWSVIRDADGLARVFIPAKLRDNRILTDADPLYVSRLKQSGSEELVRAWLDGDWDVIEGAYFDCWRKEKHVIRPFAIPEHWLRFRSMDWGSARPFSVGWWAVASEHHVLDLSGQGVDAASVGYTESSGVIPRGALVRYREWYGAKEPNVGLKLHAEQVAEGIVKRSGEEEYAYSVVDPATFAEDGGPSIAERLYNSGAMFRKADNRRIPRHGHMGGWDQMRQRFVGEDGRPMLYCFSTCVDSIRTIPVLQHDTTNPEDLDTESEDHAADEWRYACMSRPYTIPMPATLESLEERLKRIPSLNDLIKARDLEQQAENY